MFSFSTSFLGGLAVTGVLVAAIPAPAIPSDFPELFPDGIGGPLNTGAKGGLNAIPSSTYTYSKWKWGTVPRTCYEQAVGDKNCDIYDIEVFDLKVSDCDTPWPVCRCKNSPFPAANLMKRIA